MRRLLALGSMAAETSTLSQWLGKSNAASAESILNLALGFLASKHLFVASEIGLFAYLASGPSTLDQLAGRIDVPRRTLRMLADAMVALGMLEFDGDRYESTEAVQTYLSGQTADNLRPVLIACDQLSDLAWRNLGTSIRASQSEKRHGQPSEAESRICSAATDALAAGDARELARVSGFSHHRRVLDLGVGTGVFLAAVLGNGRSELGPVGATSASTAATPP
jgi:hypothetical protein